MEGESAAVSCLEKGAAPCERAAACRALEFWRGLDAATHSCTSSYTLAGLTHRAQTGNDYVI